MLDFFSIFTKSGLVLWSFTVGRGTAGLVSPTAWPPGLLACLLVYAMARGYQAGHTQAAAANSALDDLVRNVLIEGRASDQVFQATPTVAVRYAQDNVHGLVFAVRDGGGGRRVARGGTGRLLTLASRAPGGLPAQV